MSLNLQCPLNSLGYGYSGFNIAKQLSLKNENFTIFPIGHVDPNLEIDTISKNLIYNNCHNFDKNAPSIKIWHQNDLFDGIGKGNKIGFPIFELNVFSDIEKASLRSCDHLFVCSEWARQIIKENKIEVDVTVIPLGVALDTFRPSSIQRRDKTIFFNAGKWEKRKGHDFLLECFNEAFNHNDNVELWMLSDNLFVPEKTQEWVSLYKNSKLGDKIRILPRQLTHSNVYDIMKQVDCGIFPARAEGWNLELLELMACGKHVITTNYSGHTEFCNKSNSFLVDIDSLEVANDGIWFNSNGFWAHLGESQKENFIYYMREFHKKKNENPDLILQNTSGVITSQQFTWNNTVEKILKYLK
jgi:glycosyltransferase involved in cell wall biosynthesis